jgi:tRNA pseudouridine38-40 synthase
MPASTRATARAARPTTTQSRPATAEAAACLVGRHDFAAFQSAGSSVKTTVRTVTESVVREAGFGEPAWCGSTLPAAGDSVSRVILFQISGDGFLRQMVRTIVGTLVEVGSGRRGASDIERILASGDRRQAGPTAPPHGLCLVGVTYDTLGPTAREAREPAEAAGR